MYRDAIKDLRLWRTKKDRLPLIIRGARQVGKTYLVEEFGKTDFKNIITINFEKNPSSGHLFEGDIDANKIIRLIEISTNQKIEKENTLIFFDEIQQAPRALTALKYFAEDAKDYVVIAAGSLLSIAEHKGVSFSVGKVNFLNLHPFSFKEFLLASGEEGLSNLLDNEVSMTSTFHDRYSEKLREYMLVGGMPAVVKVWIEDHQTDEMRSIQKEIIESYLSDLSKHAHQDIAVKCREIINSIPSQFAKENKKFMYSTAKKGARAKDYELSLSWLESSRIINRLYKVSTPLVPMKAYEENGIFKLFMHDVGLLTALSEIDAKLMLEKDAIFNAFKGAISEQYVLQELLSSFNGHISYYSNDRSTAEVDFLLEFKENIIPLEVKAGINTKAKSLKAYKEKFNPRLTLRSSLLPYKEQDDLINIPLYAISKVEEICRKK